MRFPISIRHFRRDTQRIMRIAVVGVFAATPFLVVHGFSSPPPTTTTTTRITSSSRLFSSSENKNTFNPFNMVGDMASSLLGKAAGADSAKQKNTAVEKALSSISSLPDWESIRKQLENQMETKEERNFRNNLAKGYGVAGSPLHKVRLYDESNKEEDIRVTFYRDSASWCPYCQKVWLVLEEKRIPYRIEKINMRCYGDKPNSFLRLQPNGNIPVCIIDGRVYGQSNDIMYALEETFSSSSSSKQHKSLSPPPAKAAKANELLRLEREVFGAWMNWLTGSARSKGLFVDTLKRVERELASSSNDGPFFLGKDVSLVDFMYASFLERMAASLLYFKGFQIRVVPGSPTDYPAVNRWFDAMETLESYRLTKSDYYTHCWDLPPQLGGCTFERPAHEPYTKAINGERTLDGATTRGSWELPLQPHNGGIEPDWDWITASAAKRQAVERVSANHEAIVAFASRGAGRAGFPGVAAPLADPNAVPNVAVQSAIDAILRTISVAILDCNDQEQQLPDDSTMTRIAQILVQEAEGGGADYAKSVVDSLSYLRDRIGVPRDMTLPAARQWRAHINWAIDKILTQLDTQK